MLPLEVRPLAEAAPERFGQQDFTDPISQRSAFSLFEESLDRALHGEEDSDKFDQALLSRFYDFRRLLETQGIDSVDIANQEEPAATPFLHIVPEKLDTIQCLIRKTPPPQRTRLVGKLDMIRHHDRMFSLQLEAGGTVTGIAEDIAAEALAGHWGETVLILGTVSFRPSGQPLRIQADSVEAAPGSGSMWSKMPKPIQSDLDVPHLRQGQGTRSGLNALYGKWPGQESDEEIEALLAEIL